MRVEDVKTRLLKTAQRSQCRYQIAAIGINDRGVPIFAATNRPRFTRRGGGDHAEALVMKNTPRNLKSILLCRVNKLGEIRPIHPCKACQAMADKLGVKITTVEK